MTATYLLDANDLIALVVSDHVHHDTVASRAARVDGVALCLPQWNLGSGVCLVYGTHKRGSR
jgi:hypothetical protein